MSEAYRSGATVDDQYDNDGAIATVDYQYDNDGAIAAVVDSATGITTRQYFDFSGRNTGYSQISTKAGHELTHTVGYDFDDINNLTQLVENIDGTERTTAYTYDDDNRVTAITTDGTTVEYTYDLFGRVTQQVTKNGDTVILTEYFTFTEPSDAVTSAQVATYRTVSAAMDITHTYEYDDNGNITHVEQRNNTNNTAINVSYAYDSANQLIREDNQRRNATYTWTYDNAGNILSFNTYAYSPNVADLSDTQPAKAVPYAYGDEQWGDLLTSLNGTAISYDEIGNPANDETRSYTWQNGRQLASLTKGETTWTYTYNNAGLRTARTNGTTTYKYVYNGSQLSRMTILTGADPETQTEEIVDFTYDASGKPLTLKYAGSTYYYILNLQGDVVGIMDSTGTQIVDYAYTAYGQGFVRACVVGQTADTLVRINPFLYRGYVLDMGTGLYYLQSRYYDPAVGRFINADVYAATGQGFVGNNMFAYCLNNPVMYCDYTGRTASLVGIVGISIGIKELAQAAVVVVAAIVVIAVAIYVVPQVIDGISTVVSDSFAYANEQTTTVVDAKTTTAEPRKKSKTHVHHIVAQNDKRAAPARDILNYLFGSVNISKNLVPLSASFHMHLHTSYYYASVNALICSAYRSAGDDIDRQREAVTAALEILRYILLAQDAVHQQ